MSKIYDIKKSLLTHYYKLDWTTDYGTTREKIYLAIKGKIKPNPILYLNVRNVSMLWKESYNSKIEKISKSEFSKNATGQNVARFFGTLPNYNNLLNYSPKILNQLDKYNFEKSHRNNYESPRKLNNKNSIMNELKNLKASTKTKVKQKNKVMER